MLTNIASIESFFKDPSNIHKLYVYEIVNFDNDVESIVSSNTNNFLKLKFHSEKTGLFESVSFSPQVKILSDANDMSLKINTDYSFLTNDDFSFLEQTRKTYVFTIMKPFSQDSLVYFIGENSMRTINNLNNDVSINDLKYEELTLMYAITLQNIKKLEVGKNSTINFLLIDELPKIKKIESIDYVVPINSLYQTLQVIGDLRNDELGLTLENEKIDLELSENNGFVPITCRLTNCNVRAETEILNFSLTKQLPLQCLNEIVNKYESLDSVFNVFIEDSTMQSFVVDLVELLKKLVAISYAFLKNFDWFDKENASFVSYFNATYANKTLYEFNSSLIFDYEAKWPNAINSQAYKFFQALCYGLSHRIPTPFGVSNELSNLHKDKLWTYFELNNLEAELKKLFNKNSSLDVDQMKLFKPYAIVESKFFNIIKGENLFSLTAKNREFSQLGDRLYLPNSSQNDPNESYYQLFLFFDSWSAAIDIMQNYSTSRTLVARTKTVYMHKETNNITIDDLKNLLPKDAIDIEQISEISSELIDSDIVIYQACPIHHPIYQGSSKLKSTTEQGECVYIISQGWDVVFETKIPRPFLYKKIWKFSTTFNYKTRESEFYDVFSFSSGRIFDTIFNIVSKKTILNKYILAARLRKKGWYISKINEDLHYSFLNCANTMVLNYIDVNDELKSFKYENIKSFQRIDNKIPLTKNKY